ncbi:MAG TPA: hypothetical protein VE422_17560 [Terriglobia bacterium]|nr:hypothetical protein [Terriglobia bacterium]
MKKITTEKHQFKKLGQMCDFGILNGNRFEPGTAGADGLTSMISTVSDLRARTASQASLENRLRELLRAKLEARLALREDVELLYHTAHAVAAQVPGFDDKFQRSLWGDPKLLNAARSALQDTAAMAETFVKHATPPNFPEILKTKISNLERAREEHANGRTACTLGEKALQESRRKAVAAAKGFDAIMRNTFRGDPIILEAWKAACRVPRGRAKKEETGANGKTQPEPPPPPHVQPQPPAQLHSPA